MSKKINFLAILAACLLSLNAAAQPYTVTNDDYHRLQLHFTASTPRIGEALVEGQAYGTLDLEGYLPSGAAGTPALPTFSGLIEVPVCKGFIVEICDAKYDTLTLERYLLPSQPSRSKSDTSRHALVFDPKSYAADSFLGGTARVVPVGTARDRQLAHLEYSPVQYQPTSGTLVVCRSATINIRYLDADSAATLAHFERYHTPAFASGAMSLNSLYPKSVRTAAPVRYLIVAHSMFRNQLDTFVEWKRRKGFLTDIVYTDDPGVGSDTASIAAYLRSQYTSATAAMPAPTYLLLVGDVGQIPAFVGTTDNDHVTDLYYTTWTTGDHLPDCYYGRFSAQNVSQLTPQIEKTLMYEQYTFADPTFLDRAVMVAGVDGGSSGDYGYTHADPAMDYAITNYINGAHGFSEVRYFKNNTSITPSGATNIYIDGNSSSMSATVRSYYNQGAGLINYSAHGSATSWGTPNFTTSHVASMTNTQKFGIMIGNCCLTNKFETGTCFGESLLRKGNYCGAVGYIGGSNSTYWYEDFYWAVGLRSGIGPSMSMAYNAAHLGAYDRLCHTHNEAYPQWATSQGSLMMWGNMAVESSTSSRKHYYWEIYHLMGDPSVMPYLTQASTLSLAAASYLPYGTTTLSVNAVPYAYVALTDTLTHTLVTAAFADANGTVTLTLPTTIAPGGYELTASAQQYRTAFQPLSILMPEGAFPVLTDATAQAALDAGTTQTIEYRVANLGDSTAYDITLALTSSDGDALTFSPSSLVIDSLLPGDTVVLTATATVSEQVDDGDVVSAMTTLTWSGSTYVLTRGFPFTLNAPHLVATLNNVPRRLQPGESRSFSIPITNNGHSTQQASRLTLHSPTSMFGVSAPSQPITLPPAGGMMHLMSVHVDSLMPTGVSIPVELTMGTRHVATLSFYIGDIPQEDFEGNSYHTGGWSHGAYPWQISNGNAYQGAYCLRSATGLDHNQTSETVVTLHLATADSLSFYYKVSSEANYDKFHFLIDDNELVTASGTVDWTRFATLVPAGTHTLHFAYSKDYSVSSNSDCAWIDAMVMPCYGIDAVFRHDEVCQGETYLLDGDTIDTRNAGNGHAMLQSTDTMTFVDYTILPTAHTALAVEACDSYTFLGTEYTASDSLAVVLTDSHGCDSTVSLTLTIHHSVADTVADTVEGSSYQWNGSTYTQSGSYVQHLTTVAGCDSTVTLLLTLQPHDSTGIADIATATVSLYPNPTTGLVGISSRARLVEIYDTHGHLVGRLTDTDRLDLSHLPSGIYTIRLTMHTGTAVCRIVRL